MQMFAAPRWLTARVVQLVAWRAKADVAQVTVREGLTGRTHMADNDFY